MSGERLTRTRLTGEGLARARLAAVGLIGEWLRRRTTSRSRGWTGAWIGLATARLGLRRGRIRLSAFLSGITRCLRS